MRETARMIRTGEEYRESIRDSREALRHVQTADGLFERVLPVARA